MLMFLNMSRSLEMVLESDQHLLCVLKKGDASTFRKLLSVSSSISGQHSPCSENQTSASQGIYCHFSTSMSDISRNTPCICGDFKFSPPKYWILQAMLLVCRYIRLYTDLNTNPEQSYRKKKRTMGPINKVNHIEFMLKWASCLFKSSLDDFWAGK